MHRQRRGIWNAHTLPVGVKDGAAAVENSLAVPHTLDTELPCGPVIPLMRHIQPKQTCTHKSLYVNVHSPLFLTATGGNDPNAQQRTRS